MVLAVVALVLIAWDVYAYLTPEPDDTISEVLASASAHPIIPVAFGVLIGHWFWPQKVGAGTDKE